LIINVADARAHARPRPGHHCRLRVRGRGLRRLAHRTPERGRQSLAATLAPL